MPRDLGSVDLPVLGVPLVPSVIGPVTEPVEAVTPAEPEMLDIPGLTRMAPELTP